MSHAPRTDAIHLDAIGDSDGAMEAMALARALERENAELLELCKRALTQSARVHPDFMRDLQDAIAKVEGK